MAILYYSHLPRPPVHTASTLLYASAGAPHNIKGPSLDFSLPRPNSLLSSIKSVSKSLNNSSFPSLWLLLDSAGPVWLIGHLLTALWVLFWLLTVHSPCFFASGFSYPYNQPNQIHCPQDPGPPWPCASLVSPNLSTLHQPFPPQECHSMADLTYTLIPNLTTSSSLGGLLAAATSYAYSRCRSQATKRHSVTDRQTDKSDHFKYRENEIP